ncbi:hypothetical protein EZS27_036588 [termite gut metagenome]|uniref:Uncharacterized protein n=1 Tax=termite gut metagenome TaxID=433724 RepID=A0A5J4PUP7_9ZZZZ
MNEISFEAYICFQNLKERLTYVLANFGGKYDINFYCKKAKRR